MNWMRWALKEAGLHLAFVVIGAFLLFSSWTLQNLNRDVLREFSENRISVIVNAENADEFRKFLDSHPDVVRYEFQSERRNKAALASLYPELSSVLEPLETDYFPVSASISLKNTDAFLAQLDQSMNYYRSYVLHQPPRELQSFLGITSALFLVLWVFTLGLLLFFQVEHLSHRDEQKWSLMKMLGAKPSSVFWPVCWRQALRILASSIVAVLISYWAASRFESIFGWNWESVALLNWGLFLSASLLLALGGFSGLFLLRYRRVTLG